MYHHKDAVHVKQAYSADEVLPSHEVEALGRIMESAKELPDTPSAADELRGIIQAFKSADSNIIRPVFTRIERPDSVEAKPVEAKPVEANSVEAKPVEFKPVEFKPVEIKQDIPSPKTALQTITATLTAKQLEADILPDHFKEMASRLANMQNVVLTRSYLTLVVDIQNQLESLSVAIENGRSEEKLRSQSSNLRARMKQASQNFPACEEALSISLAILDELTLKLRSFEQISYGIADDYMDAERDALFSAALNPSGEKPVPQKTVENASIKKQNAAVYDEPVSIRGTQEPKITTKPISIIFSDMFKAVQPYMPSTKHCAYIVAALIFAFPAYQAVNTAKNSLSNLFSKSNTTSSTALIYKTGKGEGDLLATGAVGSQKPVINTVQSAKMRASRALDVPVIPQSITDTATVAAIASGDPVAMYDLGTKLREGRGIERDQAAALNWFKASSELGHIPSTIRYAKMLEKGDGTLKDVSGAITYYQRAADKGSREATHALAALYASGTNGVADFKQAFTLFDRAARAGNVDSQYNLGVLYAAGQGTKVNLAESYKWFAIAAQGGDKNAATSRDEIARQLDPQTLSNAKAQLRKMNLSAPTAEMALATEAADE